MFDALVGGPSRRSQERDSTENRFHAMESLKEVLSESPRLKYGDLD